MEIRRKRLAEWFENRSIPAKEKSYISQLLRGKAPFGEKAARRLEQSYGMDPFYLEATHLVPMHSPDTPLPDNFVRIDPATHRMLAMAEKGSDNAFEIPYWDARGSCGGGALNFDQPPKGLLIKEKSWFDKYDCKPGECIVVYADGDSMADYICDGDMVFFNKSKTTPKSGKVYLIQHPDGLRIKQLRREIDGTWVLESRNPDKRRFPDERIAPGQSDLLVIVGEQFYRQG